MRPILSRLALTLALALPACERPPPPPPRAPAAVATTAAGAPEPGPDPAGTGTASPAAPAADAPDVAATTATAAAPPAPPPTPAEAILRSAIAIEPSQRIPLAPGAETVVDPGATFEVELSARSEDARLVLVDARDDILPASAARELGASTRLTLAPAAPLVPGSRYALRLDGASQRELHDEGGRAFAPLSLPILAAGEPPPPEPKKPAGKRRRR